MKRKTTPKTAGAKPRTIARKATKLCDAGHRVAASWKPGGWCGECFAIRREVEKAEQALAEREGWQAVIGAPPDEMTMRAGTGELIVYKIPRGMMKRKGRRR